MNTIGITIIIILLLLLFIPIKCELCNKKKSVIRLTIFGEGSIYENNRKDYILCTKCCKEHKIDGPYGAYIAISNKKHLDFLIKRKSNNVCDSIIEIKEEN